MKGIGVIALLFGLAGILRGGSPAASGPSAMPAPSGGGTPAEDLTGGWSGDEPMTEYQEPAAPAPSRITKLEQMAALAKVNTDPNIRYCPICYTRFYGDTAWGWYNYDWHVGAHNDPTLEGRGHVWQESCPFGDGRSFFSVTEFINHLNMDHSYAVQL